MSRVLFLLAIGLCAVPWSAQAQPVNGLIGLFADSAGTQSTLSITPGVPTRLYIVARLDGETADGLLGAEFRITGMPQAWVVTATPNPVSVITLGNPFQDVNGTWRANIAFNTCQGTDDGTVVLYTVDVLATTSVVDQVLTVEAGAPPSNPNLDTPLINICDPPLYTAVPVFGVTTVINPAISLPDLSVVDCDIRVSDASPAPGQGIHFEAIVRNAGLIDPADSIAVRFLVDGYPLGGDVLVAPIPAGAGALVSSAVPWNVDYSFHEVSVLVDPDSLVVESSESNNGARASLPYDLEMRTLQHVLAVRAVPGVVTHTACRDRPRGSVRRRLCGCAVP